MHYLNENRYISIRVNTDAVARRCSVKNINVNIRKTHRKTLVLMLLNFRDLTQTRAVITSMVWMTYSMYYTCLEVKEKPIQNASISL